MNRDQLISGAEGIARSLGWTGFEAMDNGSAVMVLLSASGSTEQVAEASLAKLGKAIKDVGPARNYPATEEYDAEPACAFSVEPLGADYAAALCEPEVFPDDFFGADYAASVAEAEDHAGEPDEIDKPDLPDEVWELATEPLQREEPVKQKSFVEPVTAFNVTASAVTKMRKNELKALCKEAGITGYSKLRVQALRAALKGWIVARDAGAVCASTIAVGVNGLHEDVSGHGVEPRTIRVSPKEAAMSGDDQDRGGISDPKSMFTEEEIVLENKRLDARDGYTIIARKGHEVRVGGHSIMLFTRLEWENDGWTLSQVKNEKARAILRGEEAGRKAARTGKDVVVTTRGVELVERRNGRTYAREGYRFRISKGAMVQFAKSINEATWRNAGWNLALVPA